jgi:hypothetical protein
MPAIKKLGTSASDYSLINVLSKSAKRKYNTKFSTSYTTEIRDDSTSLAINDRKFHAKITIRIPHNPVRVRPAISELLKVAWTQFMPIFLGIAFLLQRLLSFIMSNKLVPTIMMPDIIVEKED